MIHMIGMFLACFDMRLKSLYEKCHCENLCATGVRGLDNVVPTSKSPRQTFLQNLPFLLKFIDQSP